MDPVVLKGEMRPPKFMRCHSCGNRGHKAAECPNRGTLCFTLSYTDSNACISVQSTTQDIIYERLL